MNLVTQYNLDGVDIDWEYPDPGSLGQQLHPLMTQLSTALHSRGKLLTAAVVSEGGTAAASSRPSSARRLAQHHGLRRRQPARELRLVGVGVNLWKGRGLPAQQGRLGVPFYSRPGYLTYAELVGGPGQRQPRLRHRQRRPAVLQRHPHGPAQDPVGLPNAGGVMSWELSQDATGLELARHRHLRHHMGGTTPPPSGRTGPITGLARQVHRRGRPRHRRTEPPIQLWTCNGTSAQTWTVDWTSDRAPSAPSANAPTSPRLSTANGVALQLYDCNGLGRTKLAVAG